MTVCNLLSTRLPKIHNNQSLTFRWRWFSTWGREGIAICFANNSRQKVIHAYRQPIGIVRNKSGEPACRPGLVIKYWVVRIQTHPKTVPATSWCAKPKPVPVNLQSLPGMARPVDSNFLFNGLGFTRNCHIQICYCKSHNIDIGSSLYVFDELAALMIKMIGDTPPATSWKCVSMECQQLLVVYFGWSGG